MHLLLLLVPALALAADPVPEPEDVRAGWTAFWLFVVLVLAVALLLWSFTRQIRKTRDNAARGVFETYDERPGAGTDGGSRPHDRESGAQREGRGRRS